MGKRTDWDLDHQVLEFRDRDGTMKKVEPFVPHGRPDQPQIVKEIMDKPAAWGGPIEVETDVSPHASHVVTVRHPVENSDDHLDVTHVIRCDGTITSSSD